MGCISLHSNLNAIIGVTIYYCVILKMVILHDAIKTGFCVFLEKNKNLFLFKNTKKIELKKAQKQVGCFEKNGFFSTLIVFQSCL